MGVDKAVANILASRGDDYFVIHKPAEAPDPQGTLCAGDLFSRRLDQSSVSSVEKELATLFADSSGFWTGSKEAQSINAAAKEQAGPAGKCAESTYGEITIAGFQTVLTSMAEGDVSGRPHPFDAVVDLGAGIGRIAAAAALMGFTTQALGVELGHQRFAMGCAAIRKFKPLKKVLASKLTLLEGDAREWAQLASKAGMRCNEYWVFFLGAKCFRDSLLDSVRA
eukprot:gnl/MRDRNA2_/MRDRNA2_21806_c0_seq1.p1 gnl/MRDRNA2_/MRDRNA2_21806_c0~~gnl/MRDRNA2_/MRDRNA2_21806_c0_seq1.p1  ORF type:complete len:261 (-),score=56.46 gnl/MRDRNA2_/MRDRNA2_21806_c0_seq1:31-702(-)